jgi:hypothetical protein
MEKKEKVDVIKNRDQKKINKKSVEELDYCTTAPSAEQARAHNEDEPCDDAREGNVD